MNELKLTINGKSMVTGLIQYLDKQTDDEAVSESDYELLFDDKDASHLGTPETIDLVIKSISTVVPILIYFLGQWSKKKEQKSNTSIKIEYETVTADGSKAKVTREFKSEKELSDFLESIESK